MKQLPCIGLAVAAALLASCDRPAKPDKAPPALAAAPDRAGPIQWNAAVGRFELNGAPVRTVKLWTFDGSTDGFTAAASKIVPAAGEGIDVTIIDPTIRSPKGLSVSGGQYPLVLIRLTRTAAGAGWDGALYYSTASHPEKSDYFGKPVSGANPAVGETATLVYDMGHQTVGGPDWSQSTIDQIRLDLDDKAGGAFVIRQVAIAENPAGAALSPVAAPSPVGPPAKP